MKRCSSLFEGEWQSKSPQNRDAKIASHHQPNLHKIFFLPSEPLGNRLKPENVRVDTSLLLCYTKMEFYSEQPYERKERCVS